MNPTPVTILCDTREPDWQCHPWRNSVPAHVTIQRATLETGDFALAGNETGAVVERKTVADLLACIGGERERFERELARSRYCGRFIVVCEGSLDALITAGSGFHLPSLLGTLAAWQRRFCPILFAGRPAIAAHFALSFLCGPVNEAERLTRRVVRSTRLPATTNAPGRTVPEARN